MPLSVALGVRALIILGLGILYFTNRDPFLLTVIAIVVIGGAWTLFRAPRG